MRIGLKVRATFRKLREEGKAGVIHYGYKFAPATGPEVTIRRPGPAEPVPSAPIGEAGSVRA